MNDYLVGLDQFVQCEHRFCKSLLILCNMTIHTQTPIASLVAGIM